MKIVALEILDNMF